MPDEEPVISAIIVSYNSREMTLDCLRTLQSQLNDVPSEVIVVDNGSTDGSVSAIRGEFGSVVVIQNDENVGFGAANNQAMRRARGEYLLLLNTDAFLSPGSVSTLVKYMTDHPDVGVVGPRLLNPDGTLQRSCYRLPSPVRAWMENYWLSRLVSWHPALDDYSRWPHNRERRVDYVIGACMLVRRAVYEAIGGFDEAFFMYSEEADWQKRMHAAGWDVAFTPSAEATHIGGASGAADRPRINRHFFDSLDYYELKHHGVVGLVLVRLAMVGGSFLRLILWSMVLIALPSRRRRAAAKLRLLSWLFVRQLTNWPVRTAARRSTS